MTMLADEIDVEQESSESGFWAIIREAIALSCDYDQQRAHVLKAITPDVYASLRDEILPFVVTSALCQIRHRGRQVLKSTSEVPQGHVASAEDVRVAFRTAQPDGWLQRWTTAFGTLGNLTREQLVLVRAQDASKAKGLNDNVRFYDRVLKRVPKGERVGKHLDSRQASRIWHEISGSWEPRGSSNGNGNGHKANPVQTRNQAARAAAK